MPLYFGVWFQVSGQLFYMTLKELIKSSGVHLTNKECSIIGHSITSSAKKNNVTYTKVDEVFKVNNYPDEFISQMEDIVIDFIKNKGGVNGTT